MNLFSAQSPTNVFDLFFLSYLQHDKGPNQVQSPSCEYLNLLVNLLSKLTDVFLVLGQLGPGLDLLRGLN